MQKAILMVILLFLYGCNYAKQNDVALRESPKIIYHIDIIQEEIESPPVLVQKDYSSFYLSKSDFIYTAGVPVERIINILKPINPIYFDGIAKIEFIKTNKFWSKSKDGWYYSDSKSIKIFVDYESDEFLTRMVLHGLKHYYCLTKERDSFNRCLETNNKIGDGFDNAKLWDYCYHDEGCFLNTPIDEEYGFIK